MNELLFLLIILIGFLIGTLLVGNLFYFFFINLPQIIRFKLNGELKSPISSLLKSLLPSLGWIIISVLIVHLISNYFGSYLKLFYCGAAISLIFNINTIFKHYNS